MSATTMHREQDQPKLDAGTLGRPRRSHQGDANTMHPAATAHPATTAVREEPSRSRSASPPADVGHHDPGEHVLEEQDPSRDPQQEGVRVPRVRWWTNPTSASAPPANRSPKPAIGWRRRRAALLRSRPRSARRYHAMRRGQVSMRASLGPVAGRSYEASPTSSCGPRRGTCPARRRAVNAVDGVR